MKNLCKKCESLECREILKVVVRKDIPGIPAGTELRKPTGGGVTGDYMSPECIDSDGDYIPSFTYLHWREESIKKFPDFFQVIYCECRECHCGDKRD